MFFSVFTLVVLPVARVFMLYPGTISVIYLIALVTVKAVLLGFHLEFHWLDPSEFYVPGKPSAGVNPA